MPIYEFTCENCKASFEELLSFSQSKWKVSCPSCGSKNTKRDLSGFATNANPKANPSGGGCSPRGPIG